MRHAVSIFAVVVALSLLAGPFVIRARAQGEPRWWAAEPDEVQELEGIIVDNDRLESQIIAERGKIRARYDAAKAYARGRRMLVPSLPIDYERAQRRWVEIAPVTSETRK